MVETSTILWLTSGTLVTLCSFAIAIVSILIFAGTINLPGVIPVSARYPSVINGRMLGVKPIAKYQNLGSLQCIQRCEDNSGCMSLNYSPASRKCDLFGTNRTVDESLFTQGIPGTDYYEKTYFWGRFTPRYSGSMKDKHKTDPLTGIVSEKQCAIQCIKKGRDCKGFNYSSADQKCTLINTILEGNEDLIDKTNTSTVYYGVLPYTIPSDPNLIADVPAKKEADKTGDSSGQMPDKAINNDTSTQQPSVNKFGDYRRQPLIKVHHVLILMIIVLLLWWYIKTIIRSVAKR